VPAKKTTLTDAKRAKRVRETARPKDFEQAYKTVVKPTAKQTSPKRPSEATYTRHGLMAIGLTDQGYGRHYTHLGRKLTDLSRWVSDAENHSVFSELGRIAEKFGNDIAQTFAREIDDGISDGSISDVADAERRLRQIRKRLKNWSPPSVD
jgi:hypothetical protein